MRTKQEMLVAGIDLAQRFCRFNGLPDPPIVVCQPAEWRVNACAYYRPAIIKICVQRCAAIGASGPAWSYPGYIADRTPYGVVAHEIGHHVDYLRGGNKGAYWSEYGEGVRAATRERPITSYTPNDAEWFAEMFRLFVTNPDLLRQIRPKTHARLIADGFKPVELRDYLAVLDQAPARTIVMASRRIREAA